MVYNIKAELKNYTRWQKLLRQCGEGSISLSAFTEQEKVIPLCIAHDALPTTDAFQAVVCVTSPT
jgi:hypothetical protein